MQNPADLARVAELAPGAELSPGAAELAPGAELDADEATLQHDVLVSIAEKLDFADLAAFRATCKLFRDATLDARVSLRPRRNIGYRLRQALFLSGIHLWPIMSAKGFQIWKD